MGVDMRGSGVGFVGKGQDTWEGRKPGKGGHAGPPLRGIITTNTYIRAV